MAVLRRTTPGWPWAIVWLWATLAAALLARSTAEAEAPNEYQVKAVFVFNFSRFVEWPAPAFGGANEPFVIGIVGNDPFGARLDEAVRGEQINQHPLQIRRFGSIGDIGACQILYIDRSQSGQLREILAALAHRSTLTVADFEGSSERGVMMQFVTESNRIRLRINVDAAKASGLTISSKLLRPAEIVSTSAKE
jgi:hypothetical protein